MCSYSCIYVSFLLVVGSARAWTIGVAGRRDDAVVSNVHLGNIKHDGDGSEPTNPSASNNDSDTLSRREVISRGLMLAGGSTLSLPSSSYAETGSTIDSQGQLPSSMSAATSLLSDYNPSEYKTLPSLGRSVFPPPFLPPINNRATYRYSLGRDAWSLEQLIAFANVTATIRTNVIKLEDGGLWVSGPLWPTEEYCALLDELGPVAHVVLPTNALEHKAAMKQFLFKYRGADVWISPGQYGPFGECGIITEDMNEEQVSVIVENAARSMGYRVDGILPARAKSGTQSKAKNMHPSWINEFDVATLCVELPGNAGPVSECAFYHKSTKTLAVTDAVIAVPRVSSDDGAGTYPLQPIFSTYTFDDVDLSNPTFWPRTVLQAVFLPLRAEPSKSGTPVYPGYEALANRLVRAPILRAFADARAPNEIREWVKQIVGFQRFDRIITAHFASPINAGPKIFAKAFIHLDEVAASGEVFSALPIDCQDWSTLSALNGFIGDNKLGAPVVYDFRRGCKEN